MDCLCIVNIAFEDDIRKFQFPSLATSYVAPDSEQLQQTEEFITSMDLDSMSSKHSKPFHPENTYNPHHARFHLAIKNKAINPGSSNNN